MVSKVTNVLQDLRVALILRVVVWRMAYAIMKSIKTQQAILNEIKYNEARV